MNLKLTFSIVFALLFSSAYPQDKLKRPKSEVGIQSVDSLVDRSFDLYDEVYDYKQKVNSGEDLSEQEIDFLEKITDQSEVLSEYAMDAASDIDGKSIFKQGKAVLQLNRAKKALAYCLKTSKEIMFQQNGTEEESVDGG